MTADTIPVGMIALFPLSIPIPEGWKEIGCDSLKLNPAVFTPSSAVEYLAVRVCEKVGCEHIFEVVAASTDGSFIRGGHGGVGRCMKCGFMP